MTTTRESLQCPDAIVDEYVSLGFDDLFIRPLSRYGFAKRNEQVLAYPLDQFHAFYERALDRILYWNREGVPIREVAACVLLNKILSPFDGGYVDLQTPTGAGLATLVYNYDGYVYPSDEARMLAEAGDTSFRLGRIGQPLEKLLDSETQHELVRSSLSHSIPGCKECAYNKYCGPDPVSAYNQFGSCSAPVEKTDHCQHHMWLFDYLFERLRIADPEFQELAYRWAQPGLVRDELVNA